MINIRNTSIGNIMIEEEDGFITKLEFYPADAKLSKPGDSSPMLDKAFHELSLYLDGKLKKFSLPLKPKGTDFQKRVWTILVQIEYGRTLSYKETAIKAGDSKAARAVGMANNKNPIPVFIPCHRVIGANGKLVGFGGGVEIKQKLLDIESKSLL